MIHLLDESLKSWIQERLRSSVNGSEIEVSFKTPDRDFDGAGPGPTINVFLWDIMKSVRSHSGRSIERNREGVLMHRGPDPIMEFRYLVSAWGAEVRDQHRLLGELMRAIVRDQGIPERNLAPTLRTVRPLPELTLGSSGGRTLADLWSAFDGQLRAGLDLVVLTTIDAHIADRASELVTESGPRVWPVDSLDSSQSVRPVPEAVGRYDVRLVQQVRPGPKGRVRNLAALQCNPSMAGVSVTSSRATSVIGKDGTCTLSAEPGSSLTVHAAQPFEVHVPASEEVPTGEGDQT